VCAFRARFGELVEERFAPQLHALAAAGMLEVVYHTARQPSLRLTPHGLRHSSAIAQLFFSPRVPQMMTRSRYDAAPISRDST
jgi:hypothetical protein